MSEDNPYDIIIVGSGIHAATALCAARKELPYGYILVVSAENPLSTFLDRKDFFFINSPELINDSTNDIPHSKGYPSEFGSDRFLTAGSLGYFLARQLHSRHADYLFGNTVVKIDASQKDGGVTNIQLDNNLKLYGELIFVAPGLGSKRYGFLERESEAKAHALAKSEGTLDLKTPRLIETFDDFSARVQKLVKPGRSPLEAYSGLRVAVIGFPGDAANVTIEAFAGMGPGTIYGEKSAGSVGRVNGRLRIGKQSNSKVQIKTFGRKFANINAYIAAAKPRYHDTIPKVFGDFDQIGHKALSFDIVNLSRKRRPIILITDERGAQHEFDAVISATGYIENWRSLYNSSDNFNVVRSSRLRAGTGVIALQSANVPRAYLIGPTIGKEISDHELRNTITANRHSIIVLAERTAPAVVKTIQDKL